MRSIMRSRFAVLLLCLLPAIAFGETRFVELEVTMRSGQDGKNAYCNDPCATCHDDLHVRMSGSNPLRISLMQKAFSYLEPSTA